MCMGSSTRHIVTFDGLDFKLTGNCSYTLLQDREHDIEVILHNGACSSTPKLNCMNAIEVKHHGKSIQLSSDMTVSHEQWNSFMFLWSNDNIPDYENRVVLSFFSISIAVLIFFLFTVFYFLCCENLYNFWFQNKVPAHMMHQICFFALLWQGKEDGIWSPWAALTCARVQPERIREP